MKNLSSLLLCACMLVTVAYGQGDVRTRGAGAAGAAPTQTTRKVTGRVVDAAGQPLAGASVSVVDAAGAVVGGVYSDANGAFTVSVPEGTGYRLRVSYVSFGTSTTAIEATGDQTLRVEMQESESVIDEVQIRGYGTELRRESKGAIATVKGDDIANLPVTSLEQAIQGRMAGVQITSSSGKLGSGFNIRIRGSASLSAANNPLYVVDGIIFTNDYLSTNSYSGEANNPIADLNPNDIESIDVLKDAAAAAIYGARGANGVVIITTRRGKAGKSSTTINYAYGISSPTRRRGFLNEAEYVSLFNEAYANVGGTNPAFAPDGQTADVANYTPGTNTNWEDLVLLNNRPMQQVDISNSGGNERTQYFISFGFLEQFGILIGNRLTRASGRLNLDHKVSDKAKVGGSFAISRTLNERLSSDRDFATPLQAVALAPIDKPRDPVTGELNPFGLAYFNPLVTVENRFFNTVSLRTLGNVYVELALMKDFTWRSSLGVDILDQREDFWSGRRIPAAVSGYNIGGAIASNDRVLNYITTNYATWNSSFSDVHKLNSTLGFEFQFRQRLGTFVQGEDFATDDFRYVESAARITAGSSFVRETRFSSLFWRVDYKFKDKLLVGGSIRFDGSSRFGPDSRYGFFPAASVGYILSEEEFIKNLDVFTLVKPRVSWGRTGNAEIGDYPWQNFFAASTYKESPGLIPQATIGDRALSWEQVDTWNIGLDVAMFNNRLSFSMEWYRRKTEGLLLNVQLPAQSGYVSSLKNLGSLENRGWEFAISGRVLTGEVKWTASANLAINNNKVLGLDPENGNAPIFLGSGGLENRAVVGQPLSVFYGVRFLGVDPANGDALFQGPNGPTNNFNIAQQAREFLGQPLPIYTGGITNTVSYKGFDFSMFWQFSLDFDIYNWAGRFMSSSGDFFDNQTRDQLNAWRQPGDITNVPQLRLGGGNGIQQTSRYIYDGSFWRLKTLTVGYTLPTEWVSKISLTKVRLYVTGQNLVTITDYPGWDPEVNSLDRTPGNVQGSNLNIGWDFYTAPQPKTWLFGVQITL